MWLLRLVFKLMFWVFLFGAIAAVLYWQKDRVKKVWEVARNVSEAAAPLKDLLP